MKWDLALRLAKYFGVISPRKSDEWVEDEYQPFYFEVNSDGELFAVSGHPEDGDEEDILD